MSGKRPTDDLIPPAKKRGNERQITKDDAEEEDGEPVEAGNFARADEDVLKKRKIVRARRPPASEGGTGAANPFAGVQLTAPGDAAPVAPAPAANPFAGISLFPAKPAEPAKEQPAAAPEEGAQQEGAPAAAAGEQEAGAGGKDEAAAANGAEAAAGKDGGADKKEARSSPAAACGGFGSLAGAAKAGGGLLFGGVGSTGGFGSLASAASGSAFTFGATGAAASSGASSIFSFSTTAAPSTSFNFAPTPAAGAGGPAAAPPAGGSIFGTHAAFGTSTAPAKPAASLPEEAAVATGEEGESTVFSGEGVLFEFDASKQWRERGRGEMRVNAAPSGQARLVMRQRGNLRLLLNANLWGDMQVTRMEGGKGATFACINAVVPEEAPAKKEGAAGAEGGSGGEGQEGGEAAAAAPAAPKLSTWAFRVKSAELLDQFLVAVNSYKGAGGKEEGAAGQEEEGDKEAAAAE